MVTLLKVAGLILGLALVGACAAVPSADVPQVESELQAEPAATEMPAQPTLQENSPTLEPSLPGEVETATFALG